MISLKNKRILVTGGAGFLGKQVVEQLTLAGAVPHHITVPRSRDCDLRRLDNCYQAVAQQDIVIHLAAHVGGIGLNRAKPAELFYDNLMMGAQLIHAAYETGVEKFVCLGTICAYPKFTPVPINLGTHQEIAIRDLVPLIGDLMGFEGEIIWETDEPNGQPRRCLDTTKARAKFGFMAQTNLRQGLQETIAWYRGTDSV